MRPTNFAAILLALSQVYLGTALPTNRHELIAKRGDLTVPLENRAFAPSADFYPRGGADDLETRELEEFWLIARGDEKPKPRPLPVPPRQNSNPAPPAPRPLPPVPAQTLVQAPPPRPAYASRPLPPAKGKAKVRY
ncbi:hypothetical protein K443DRAFT_685440 [Laccaria amethystina LaAM-08-1]|uniref:Uncharacterized protein n=1 Tax=Laccaria amethystina LaAM-08-1 TaxID=1095629 RepID=A0A0C9WI16_9AGAR|nr:hypothetical protein K443DRAFT_685440 [Laccaria amethystina LaAM-08-1]